MATRPRRLRHPGRRTALALLVALAAPAAAAHASPDECDLSGRWRAIEDGNSALVPTDGVFVIHGDRSSWATADDVLAPVTVTVTLDDVEVEGALDSVDLHDTSSGGRPRPSSRQAPTSSTSPSTTRSPIRTRPTAPPT
ncbi:MAG: hypothetical protein R3B09_00315 [Nannocystaceae bacterium]